MRLKHVCARGYVAWLTGIDVRQKHRDTPSRCCNCAKPPTGKRADPVVHCNNRARLHLAAITRPGTCLESAAAVVSLV